MISWGVNTNDVVNADGPAAPARSGRDDAPGRRLGDRGQDGRALDEAAPLGPMAFVGPRSTSVARMSGRAGPRRAPPPPLDACGSRRSRAVFGSMADSFRRHEIEREKPRPMFGRCEPTA
jgi:hypothetical protein